MSKKKINKKLAQIFFFGFLVLFFGVIFYMPKTIPMVFADNIKIKDPFSLDLDSSFGTSNTTPAAIIGGTAYSLDDLNTGQVKFPLPEKSGNSGGGKKLGYSFLESLPDVSNATPGSYLQGMIKVVIMITTALAVLMITIAGIEHIAGAGNESKRTAAKEKMWGALLGLILAATSYLILNTINPNLLKLDLNVNTISSSIKPESAVDDSGNIIETPIGESYTGADGNEYIKADIENSEADITTATF